MHIEQHVEKRYGARLMYATHVIGSNSGMKVRRPKLPNSGIMIHTVMCYSASEAKAPVYGGQNQRFMLEAAIDENKRRETWYWPESSYWVGFDSSVSLQLLPYLDARWSDIKTMADIGVNCHLTFSSGWEWGYVEHRLLEQALTLQSTYLRDKKLLRFMAGLERLQAADRARARTEGYIPRASHRALTLRALLAKRGKQECMEDTRTGIRDQSPQKSQWR